MRSGIGLRFVILGSRVEGGLIDRIGLFSAFLKRGSLPGVYEGSMIKTA